MRPLLLSIVALVVCSGTVLAAPLAGSGGPSAATGASGDGVAAQTDAAPNPCVGTVAEPPQTDTVISIQGTRLTEDGYEKTNALLTAYGPNGSFEWARNATDNGRWWAYDVDRTPDGDLLFATTEAGNSVVGEVDPETNDYVWLERFDGAPDSDRNPLVTDAHDADLLGDGELVIADKGQGHERLLVYDREAGEVVWEWRFENYPEHFPESAGGPPQDWTHVNDVDPVGDDWFMASVRNFDQVVFVNRTSKEVELTLGSDDDYEILDEQHNPDYLEGPNGEHTVLVADSLNDRVVEYEYDESEESWDRVWSVGGFDEPRDADRLPNGNTLVTDRMDHRVVEITPEGEVVWEVYTPYEPYDAERGDPGSQGPTMREVGVEGTFEEDEGEQFATADVEECAAALFEYASEERRSSLQGFGGNGSDGATPGTGDPASDGDDGLPVPALLGAAAVLVGLIAAGVGYRRFA